MSAAEAQGIDARRLKAQVAADITAYLDSDIGVQTLQNYKPAVPVTMEGILYAGAGFVIGYLLMSGIWRFGALPLEWRQRAAYKY